MRLIDADEFMENLIYCDGLGRRGLEAVLKTLKEQPTAYDVEKVVAEIEEDKFKHPFDEDEELINSYIDRAIKAVRKGGVE